MTPAGRPQWEGLSHGDSSPTIGLGNILLAVRGEDVRLDQDLNTLEIDVETCSKINNATQDIFFATWSWWGQKDFTLLHSAGGFMTKAASFKSGIADCATSVFWTAPPGSWKTSLHLNARQPCARVLRINSFATSSVDAKSFLGEESKCAGWIHNPLQGIKLGRYRRLKYSSYTPSSKEPSPGPPVCHHIPDFGSSALNLRSADVSCILFDSPADFFLR